MIQKTSFLSPSCAFFTQDKTLALTGDTKTNVSKNEEEMQHDEKLLSDPKLPRTSCSSFGMPRDTVVGSVHQHAKREEPPTMGQR